MNQHSQTPDPLPPVAAHPLRAWRQEKGLSLRELAARLTDEAGQPMISYASLGRIERGLQPPPWAVLRRLHELSGGVVRPDHWLGEPDAAGSDTAGAEGRS